MESNVLVDMVKVVTTGYLFFSHGLVRTFLSTVWHEANKYDET